MSDTGHAIEAGEADLTSPSFAVLVSEGKCWKCAELTAMAAIWVPSYTEIEADVGHHQKRTEHAVLHYVGGLSEEVHRQVLAVAPWLRYTHTEGAGTPYLANHCQRCGAVQGDWFVFGVDGPFFPQTKAEIDQIKVVPGEGTLHANASAATSGWMDDIKG